jgi:hypothetical protein
MCQTRRRFDVTDINKSWHQSHEVNRHTSPGTVFIARFPERFLPPMQPHESRRRQVFSP